MTLTRLLRELDRPYLLLVLATLAWGGNAVAGRLAVGEVSPMAIVSLRWLVVIVALGAVAGRRTWSELRGLRTGWLKIALMGALGFTAFNALFYWAAHRTTAVNMGLIQGVTPGLVLAMGRVVYGTPIGRAQILGLAISCLGIVVVACRGSLEVLRHLTFNVGDIAILAASVLYAGYTVSLKVRPSLSPLGLFSAISLAAFLTSLPLLGLEGAAGALQWPTPKGWLIVLFIALVPSLLAQLWYMRGIELIGPGRAGQFMNLIPAFAAIFGVAILGETFALYHAAALALVLGGIWLAERYRPRVAA